MMTTSPQGTSGTTGRKRRPRWIAALLILLFLGAGTWWVWQRHADAADHERRAADLEGIGHAMAIYSQQFNDRLPSRPKLGLSDVGIPGQPGRLYLMLHPGGNFLSNQFASSEPLIIEQPASWPKSRDLGVLYFDGHVQFHLRAEVEAMIPKD